MSEISEKCVARRLLQNAGFSERITNIRLERKLIGYMLEASGEDFIANMPETFREFAATMDTEQLFTTKPVSEQCQGIDATTQNGIRLFSGEVWNYAKENRIQPPFPLADSISQF